MSKKNHLPKKQKRSKKIQISPNSGFGTGICFETETHSLCLQLVNLDQLDGFTGRVSNGCGSDDDCNPREVCGDHGTCENKR